MNEDKLNKVKEKYYMTEQSNQVWKMICNQYEKTGRLENQVKIPQELKDFKEEIARELIEKELIRKYDFYGKQYINCELTFKGVEKFKSEKGV